jgi:alkylation response protein AidB-like acyl-CoA dehydrogenase
LVQDRIARLLDPDTAFLGLSPLAAFGMYDGEVPAVGKVKINEIGEGTSEINRQIIARSLLREVGIEKAREEVAVQ